MPLKILFIEDMVADHELTVFELKNFGLNFESVRVDTEQDFILKIKEFNPEIIISDYTMPEFDGMKALKIAKELIPDIPFILLTGSINETTAVDCMKAGANDYIIKGHSERLPYAINEALENANLKKEKTQFVDKLLKSEEKYKIIAEKTTDVIWLLDLNGKSTYVTPSIYNFTGFTVDEYLKQTINTRFTPGSAAKAKITMFKEISRYAERKEALKNYNLKIELEYLCKDGSTKWGEAIVTPWFDDKNNLIGLHGVTRDITKQKKSNELINMLSVAVEQSPAVIVITNLDAKIIYANQRTCEITGYTKDELYGKNPNVLKSGETKKETYIELWKTLLNGEIWKGEFTNKKKNGDFYIESAIIAPIKNENNITTHYIAVKEDITLKKQMEQELIKTKERAEESNRLKSSFINNITHEMRTPLNSIVGFGGLLTKQNLTSQKKQEYLEILKKSSNRLLATITNYMDISQLESKTIPIKFKMFDVNAFIYELSFKNKLLCNNKNLGYETVLPEKLESFKTYSDPNLLLKVFEQLIDNAIKFTEEGKITVGYDIENKNIKFYVKDTGIGVAKENYDIIFEHFRQIFTSNKTVISGSGLGLAIAKEIINLLGGDIYVESEVGMGSIFFFNLPIQTIEEFHINKKNKFNEIKNPSILIVEDDIYSMMLLKNIIYDNFFANLFYAANGKQAIEIVESHPDINIVLMDLRMPEMDGYEATQTIKTINNKIPIIAVTAFSDLESKEKAYNAGCDDFIYKPIDLNVLLFIFKQFGINSSSEINN